MSKFVRPMSFGIRESSIHSVRFYKSQGDHLHNSSFERHLNSRFTQTAKIKNSVMKKFFKNKELMFRSNYNYVEGNRPFDNYDSFDLFIAVFALQRPGFRRTLPDDICYDYPSIISEDGKYYEYLDAEMRLHRKVDKPSLFYSAYMWNYLNFTSKKSFSVKSWFFLGKPHRKNKPATLYNSNIVFHDIIDYLNSRNLKLPILRKVAKFLFHRDYNSEWYLHGISVTKAIQQWGKDNAVFVEDMTEEDEILFRMRWG